MELNLTSIKFKEREGTEFNERIIGGKQNKMSNAAQLTTTHYVT